MKKYNNPMLQVVSINHNDIITGSETIDFGSDYNGSDAILAPGRRGVDDWDAGY